jgi:hypothetical protein
MQDIDALIGNKIGVFDVACPLCGPSRRSPVSQRRQTLRIFRLEAGFAGFHCARCGMKGHCLDGSVTRLTLNQDRSRFIDAAAQFKVAIGREQRNRVKAALRIWSDAVSPRGSVVEQYLSSRRLSLPDDLVGDVVRFHAGDGAMVCLFRDIESNEPCGIHRTYLDRDGGKIGRKMLGRAKNAAIKLDADENVTLGLHIGEGVETCLAARMAGFRPAWALGSAGGIDVFPVLSGIEAISILGEINDGGANVRAARECAARWIMAGREALLIEPLVGDDLNDVWREVSP